MIDPSSTIRDHSLLDPSTHVGKLSLIGYHVRFGTDVSIGERVIINGTASEYSEELAVAIGNGVRLEDSVVIVGPLTIGAHSIIRTGTIVTESIPAESIVEGNPARVVGYLQRTVDFGEFVDVPSRVGETIQIAGCKIMRLPKVSDLRGNLTFAEIEQYLPFEPKRFFVVYGVPNEEVRGSHAHHELHELLICVNGSVTVTLDNGSESGQVLLDDPTLMIHLQPKTWTTQYNYSHDAVLVVLCSHVYEANDYIRNYDRFMEVING